MERGVTYAVFGKSNRGDADVEYIGSYDLVPTERDVDGWLEDYPVVSVSRDVLGEDGVWVSVETEFYRVDEVQSLVARVVELEETIADIRREQDWDLDDEEEE